MILREKKWKWRASISEHWHNSPAGIWKEKALEYIPHLAHGLDVLHAGLVEGEPGLHQPRLLQAETKTTFQLYSISFQLYSFTAFQLCRFAALQHFSFTAFQIYSTSACTIHGCFKLQPKQLFSFTQSRWIRRQKPRPPGVKTRFTFLPKSSKLLKVSATIWINVPRLPGWKRWSTLFRNIINNIQVFYKT